MPPGQNVTVQSNISPGISAPCLPVRLSRRELEIIGLLLLGMTNKEIARQLFLSPETVKTHISRTYRKLGARNRAHAAIKAIALIPNDTLYLSSENHTGPGMVAESDRDYDAAGNATGINPSIVVLK
ncbi:MAG: response regulator transcription factor [Thermoleophilia bacterium]